MARTPLLLVIAVQCALMGGTEVSFAHSDGADLTASRIADALRLMATLYPEEHEKADRFQITGRVAGMETRFFGVQFSGGEPLSSTVPEDFARSLCYASFAFWEGGLSQYTAQGNCVNDRENVALRTAIKGHPEWSDERISRELSKRGANFGPNEKARVAERIPPTYLISELTGEPLRFREIEFSMPQRDDDGMCRGSQVDWLVTFDVPGTEHLRVLISLEPFNGRVTSIFSTREVGVPG